MRFHWRRLVVKEYGTPFGWVTILVLMTMYNLWMAGTWDQHRQDIRRLQIILIVAAICWIVAFSLKKTRTIVAD